MRKKILIFVALISFYCISHAGPTKNAGYTYRILDAPGTAETYATNTNNRGQIAGYYYDGNHYFGYLFSKNKFMQLATPSSVDIEAIAVNNHGLLAGQYFDSGHVGAFIYKNGTFTPN